ncbi:LAQU0S06e02256g1_1 [Lachancea quebecensis]|uniref:LAQU0S06e02256g1_1 n=1 Tax=Lachancea quebecensis TaxID=1654605 RepID=A0A0P1KRN3_9SACH|nr:LAQU0S06e02256g1_1 [Lachancea quebecensis]
MGLSNFDAPLHLLLYSDTDYEERRLRVGVNEITKDFLNSIVNVKLGITAAWESHLLYYESQSFNVKELICLQSKGDLALFKTQLRSLGFAKIGIKARNCNHLSWRTRRLIEISGEHRCDNLAGNNHKGYATCFTERQEPMCRNQTTGSKDVPDPFEDMKQGREIHWYIICDGCGPRGRSSMFRMRSLSPKDFIQGTRFKCTICKNFDLCSLCNARGVENYAHQSNHPMLRIHTSVNICRGPGPDPAIVVLTSVAFLLKAFFKWLSKPKKETPKNAQGRCIRKVCGSKRAGLTRGETSNKRLH